MRLAVTALLLAAACGAPPVVDSGEGTARAPDAALEAWVVAVLDENDDLRRALDRVAEGWSLSDWWAEVSARGAKHRSREGWVLGVNGARLRISLGASHGYERGDEFLVRSGRDYVGRLRLDWVGRTKAEGTLVESGAAAPARIGDEVVARKEKVRAAPAAGGDGLEETLVAALRRNVDLKTALSRQWREWEKEDWWAGIADRRRARGRGWVLRVRRDQVRVSLGRRDGLERRDVLDLRRGERLVGRMVVGELFEERAAGVVDPARPGPAFPPRPGDVVIPAGRGPR